MMVVMKKLFYVTSIIVLACVIASGMIIPITSEASTKNELENVHQVQSSEYIIKGRGDRIVVYKGKSDKPYLETTTAVSSLPKDVQFRINKGISYDSEESMKKALDEFCS